ncbi:hypothetical protein J2Z44_003864 [Clostridium punense]|uniref:Carbohydrate-binding module family 96 domain-containing protein n=1 Tax=Clostridium punense TaxID=1054297 RepID=A0ABS4K892_9CLOT|nr:DNRLRE domain-containing protein [Clostridium punense]MBP2024014.1 hypothetical protein [Clostridium punense]
MAVILVPATKSLTVTNKIPFGNINDNTIIVGDDGEFSYISYLYFDISSIPSDVLIVDAELILFKTNNFYNNLNKVLYISSISDYFSTYTNYNNRPKTNGVIKKTFFPLTSKISVSINVTNLLRLWSSNQLKNTGVVIFSDSRSDLSEFGSAVSDDRYIIPFLRVIVKPMHNESETKKKVDIATTKKIQVIGAVEPHSKYEAVVNVEVTRANSGKVDNYYVADEYDNSEGMTSLSIDKTYNVAIIPAEKAGDEEVVNFYGSYKE